jgi:hypothetical protein
VNLGVFVPWWQGFLSMGNMNQFHHCSGIFSKLVPPSQPSPKGEGVGHTFPIVALISVVCEKKILSETLCLCALVAMISDPLHPGGRNFLLN